MLPRTSAALFALCLLLVVGCSTGEGGTRGAGAGASVTGASAGTGSSTGEESTGAMSGGATTGAATSAGAGETTTGAATSTDASGSSGETGTAACGDLECGPGETCASCPEDCGECPTPGCGDGVCDAGEDCASCGEDCGACPAQCGDGMCAGAETCGACPEDCGGCVPVFDEPQVPGPLQEQLTCNFPWAQALSSVVQVGQIGGAATSVVGIDDDFGGIGAKFELLNNDAPGNYVNVLEPRSGAGAGWQTSFLVEDWPQGVGIIVFNQAAGNSTGYQWGYRGTFVEDGKNIFATTYNPLVSDHIHLKPEEHSPCEGTGYLFDDGAVAISGTTVETPHGKVVVWKNSYRYRSRVNQSWPSWSAEQAFYLSRSVARMGNLRLYLRRGETHHGPYAPHDGLDIPEATCVDSHCNTLQYDYAVLVWNIFGKDIGVAIPDLKYGTSINLEKTTYCGNAGSDVCGNINFHAWIARVSPANFAAGEVRVLEQLYYVGTPQQLAELGFAIW